MGMYKGMRGPKESPRRGAMAWRKSVATPDSLPRSDNICCDEGASKEYEQDGLPSLACMS